MSMLTLECDELREKAKLLRAHADGLSAPYVVPSTKELMALAMLDSAKRMEDAADTIEGLRDRLQADAMGGGTCEWLSVESCHSFAGPGWECSNCGHEVGEYEHDFYNCCPICCAKVREEESVWSARQTVTTSSIAASK